MISKPLVKYVLTAALRDKLVITLVGMILMGASLGVFLGSATITEGDSFAAVFGSGGLRFLGVVGIVLFVSFYMRRSFETKEVEFLLSRPISRMAFLISHALAFILISFAVTALILAAVYLTGRPHMGGFLVWGLSIAAEGAIMATAALFFSMVLSSAAGSALATLGLYVLARLMGTLLGISKVPPENILFAVLNNVMELVSIVIPRLDLMGQTSWLIYGVDGTGGFGLLRGAGAYAERMIEVIGPAGFVGFQGVVFVGLLIAAAAYDFVRREF